MKSLVIDPGEATGWSVWDGTALACGNTTPMWPFALDVWSAIEENDGPLAPGSEHLGGVIPEGPIERFIVEDFRLYPWELRTGSLDWDGVRTARLIGALTFISRLKGIDLHLQPAKIKERAEAGGARELFFTPLKENRHVNDSIRHGSFFMQTEVLTGKAQA